MIITEKDVHSNEKRGPVREEISNIHLRILPNKQRIEQLARKNKQRIERTSAKAVAR